MKLRTRHLLLFSSALLLSSGLYALRKARDEPSMPSNLAYQRALGKSAATAQAKLEASTDLWEDHSTWENAWVVDGDYFAVRTTNSRLLANEVLQGQEAMRGFMQELLQGEGDSGQICPIFLFSDRAAYNVFGDDHGQHHSSILGGFYASAHPEQPIATYVDENRTRTQMWITHNGLHEYIATNFGGTPPVWISEGLASYFALHWDFDYGVRELELLKQADRLLSFEQLIGEDLAAYPADSQARFIQLGMMFTYLLRFNEDTRQVEGEAPPLAPFDEYLRAVVRGEPAEELPFALYFAEERSTIVDGFFTCTFR